MQHTVGNEKGKFPNLSVTVALGLLLHSGNTNHNVTKQQFPGIRVKTGIVFFCMGKIPRCIKVQHGERQHIYDGRVQVVDNQRISVTQEQSVLDAMNLREEGKSAAEIKEILEKEKLQASIYITVDTLKYLKKGGRITPAAAAIGTVLNLKPVLQIQGEKLDAFSKARGWKTAKKTMLNAIEKDLNGRFADVKDQMVLGMAYTCSKEEAQEWKAEIEERFPGYEIMEGSLSLSVACHIGPGALAITCMKRL